MSFDVKDLPDLIMLEEARSPATTQAMDLLLSLAQDTHTSGIYAGFWQWQPPSPMYGEEEEDEDLLDL